MTRFLFLIPLLPLVGFVLNFLVGVRVMRRRLGLSGPGLGAWPGAAGEHDAAAHAPPPAFIGIIACGTVLLSFLVSLYAVVQAHHAPGHTLVETLWTWVAGG